MPDIHNAQPLRRTQRLDVLVEQEPGVVEAELGAGAAAGDVQRELALRVRQLADVVADAGAGAERADRVGQRDGEVVLQAVGQVGDVAERGGQGVFGDGGGAGRG